jgi:hypothetical protein
MYSRKLLMMGREGARNMGTFIKINLNNQCVWLVIKKKNAVEVIIGKEKTYHTFLYTTLLWR